MQRVLTDVAQELNGAEAWRDVIAAPFELHRGDEIQALLRLPSHSVDALQLLSDRVREATPDQRIAFGIGWGSLSTTALPAAPERSLHVGALDGPCFHNARAALERARKRKVWARFEGFGAAQDTALDGMFELMDSIRGDWTPKQFMHTLELRRRGQQKLVAQHLQVNPSVISESLKAAHFEAIRSGEAAARVVLRTLDPARPTSDASP